MENAGELGLITYILTRAQKLHIGEFSIIRYNVKLTYLVLDVGKSLNLNLGQKEYIIYYVYI